MFVLQNTPQKPLQLHELAVSEFDGESTIAKFDLTLAVDSTDRGHKACLTYSTALFDHATIERMLGHYRVLLEGIASDSERPLSTLPLLTQAEHHQILTQWNATHSDYPRRHCIHQVYAEQAAQTPDKVAAVFGKRHLTYAQLNDRSNQLAHYLRRRGVGPDVLVGICMQRSLEMLVGLLGILKAGGAYVPIDADYPEQRIAFMLEDSQIEVLVTQAAQKNMLQDHKAAMICLDTEWDTITAESTAEPEINTQPDHLAYINYTSGSTGKPKGVAIPHRGVMRLVFGSNYARLDADRVLLHMSTISFDASTFELWAALLHGAKCVLLEEQLPTPGNLKKAIAAHKVDTMFITTALFNTIVDVDPGILEPVQQILTGGEAASSTHIHTALRRLPNTHLSNVYGPTECTTFATHYPLSSKKPVDGTSIPIGKPISNTHTFVVDKHMQLLPIGIRGELVIGGDGLARGYLNRPELTDEKFIPNHINPDAGTHLYRTGDLVRYLPDGNIEFLDRIDQQVKIRGFRIEIGEIEAVLTQHPAVHQAVVIARQDADRDSRLVAYVVTKRPHLPSIDELRMFVQSHLPTYMEPAAYMIVEELPLTPNGKVDRKALPAPDLGQNEKRTGFAAPANNLELQLAKIWEKQLDIRPIGVEDNFFDMGGHSLLAVRVISEINKITGHHLPVAALFHAPTIRRLAENIKQKGWTPPYSWLVPIQPFGSRIPYFQIHGTVNVVHHLDRDQPYYEIDYYGTDGGRRPVFKTVAEKANEIIQEIRTVQPKGPYLLGGFCFGGLLAIEIAHQLTREGEQVPMLFLMDPSIPEIERHEQPNSPIAKWAGIKERLMTRLNTLKSYVKVIICRTCLAARRPLPEDLRRFYISRLYERALQRHVTVPYPGPVILSSFGAEQTAEDWKDFFTGEVENHTIECNHMSAVEDSVIIQVWAENLNSSLRRINAKKV